MTIRTTPNPVIRAAGRGLKRLNDRHPWNHNEHFHGWILRSLPEAPARVLDVGSGGGELVAALTTRAARVEGIDPDPAMSYAAATRFQDHPRVQILRRGLSEHAAHSASAESYDALTMVASLHHMDPAGALAEARSVLRPGGRLLIVTLTRPETRTDHVWDVVNALTNPLIGLVKHPRPVRPDDRQLLPAAAEMPVRDAEITLAQLREIAAELLPGARIRRRQGFRVTLAWQKPAA